MPPTHHPDPLGLPANHTISGNGTSRRRPEDEWGVRMARLANVVFCRGYHRTHVRAPHHLPRDGPGILVCNHISGLDPVLIQSVLPRLVVWMMAKEYYDIPSLGWLFKLVHAIPVARRGRDMAATRLALRALEEGYILGVFPEGRIETSRELLPFETGVAWMALKSGAPVYPAYLEGTQRGMEMLDAFLNPNDAVLTFGPEVSFERGDNSAELRDAATAAIQRAVQQLRPAANVTRTWPIWRL